MTEQSIATPKWSTDSSIYEKDKFFVFKDSKVDKKVGISIKKFSTKKEFTEYLKDFDYVFHTLFEVVCTTFRFQ